MLVRSSRNPYLVDVGKYIKPQPKWNTAVPPLEGWGALLSRICWSSLFIPALLRAAARSFAFIVLLLFRRSRQKRHEISPKMSRGATTTATADPEPTLCPP